jgi:hypothetical protein
VLLGAVALSSRGQRPSQAQPADQSQATRRCAGEPQAHHSARDCHRRHAATDENSLIERATQIIGENLYPDNFGLLLLNEASGILWSHASYRERDTTRGVSAPIPLGKASRDRRRRGTPWRITTSTWCRNIWRSIRDPLRLCADAGGRTVDRRGERRERRLAAFTESDERLLTTLAGQLATAIDRLRAEAAVRYRWSWRTWLSPARRSSPADPEQVYAAIHHAVALADAGRPALPWSIAASKWCRFIPLDWRAMSSRG